EDLASINKADLILVTHGHFDHVGQAADIAKKTGARLVTNYDLGNALAQHGGYPANQMGFDSLGNMGGKIPFFNGDINIAIVPAVHSSSVNPKALGASDSALDEFGGAPVGFVIQIKNGPTLYHTGDTDVYGDMALISQFGKIDLMLACIGDHFTMGPERAALAVQWVKPVNVAPMHYGTFPGLLTGTPEEFKKFLKIKGLGSKFKQLVIHQPIKL
ncbi:MAG: metal-dependent hydrolase, partial [Cyanobacteria bacterium]|nr:metal-dependent hydrolase [Cyanobacteriota bacterium]